jgi:hypothetical protein
VTAKGRRRYDDGDSSMTVFLLSPRREPTSKGWAKWNLAKPGRHARDKWTDIIAEDKVVITEPTRHADGRAIGIHVGGRQVRPDRGTIERTA